MVRSQSPLLGYNNNVRHHGRVFHIQTEDSGVARPHVITHLFADGGRVVKTTRTSYADRLDEPKLGAFVKKLMQDQHKAMFIALRDGQFDDQVAVPVTESPVDVDAPRDEFPELSFLPDISQPVTRDPIIPPVPDDPADTLLDISVGDIASLPAELLDDDGGTTVPPDAPVSFPPPLPPAPPSVRALPPRRGTAPPLRDALLRPITGAIRVEGPPSSALSIAAPVALSVAPSVAPSAAPPTTPPGSASSPPPLPRLSQAPMLPAAPKPVVAVPGRYVAPRPAASVTAGARPRELHASIFAESLVSEQSLDEVILAYLAEELGTPPRT